MNKKETEFLTESNAIEGVRDDISFLQAGIAWEYLKKQKTMNSGVILKTHKILMLHSNLSPYHKGYFRNVMVWVGDRAGLNAVKIPDAIKQWVKNVNDVVDNGKKENSIFLERITQAHHIKYEKIHPFIDGNGRTGRMFLNWERLKLKLPLLIIHTGEEQSDYYKWFKEE